MHRQAARAQRLDEARGCRAHRVAQLERGDPFALVGEKDAARVELRMNRRRPQAEVAAELLGADAHAASADRRIYSQARKVLQRLGIEACALAECARYGMSARRLERAGEHPGVALASAAEEHRAYERKLPGG